MTPARNSLSTSLLLLSVACVTGAAFYAKHTSDEAYRQQYRLQILRSMIATTDHGFVVLNPAGQIVEWGPGAAKIFGWSAAEVLGSSPDFMMPKEYRANHHAVLERQDGRFACNLVEVEGWAYTKDGRMIPIHVVVSSFKNHHGYYHVALFTALDKPHRVDNTVSPPVPEPVDKRPQPQPSPVPPPPTGPIPGLL
jgi:PAS domain S-box-containing protein